MPHVTVCKPSDFPYELAKGELCQITNETCVPNVNPVTRWSRIRAFVLGVKLT